MASIDPVRLPGTSLNQPVSALLTGSGAEKQIVNTQLNSALKVQLTASATVAQEAALANLLQSLAPGDLSADQNLPIRDFVTKYTTLPSDPAAKQAAQAAIAVLSSTTTVAALLGLNSTVANNPALSGIVAQTNLATLLNTSTAAGTAQLQTDFIAKYAAFQGTAQEFWTELSQDAEFKSAVPELQFTMQLGALTFNNPALVGALRTAYKPSSLRDLTKLDAPALTQLITSQHIAVPTGISGSTPADQLTNYVSGIVSLLEAVFPTVYVAKGLATSPDSKLQSVAKVLSNAPDIDLQTTNIAAYLKQNSAKAFQNIPADQVAVVTARLESVQRIFRVSQDSPTVNALIAANLDSASKIAPRSRTAFVNQFRTALGGDSQAQAAYAAATHINAQALNVYRTIQSGLKEISPRAIGTPVSKLVQTIQQQIPNWAELFGSTSFCECSECGSVYGAAASLPEYSDFTLDTSKQPLDSRPIEMNLVILSEDRAL